MGRGRCALVVFAAVLTTACGGMGHRGHDRPAQQKDVGPAKHRSPSSRPKRAAPGKRRDEKPAKAHAKPPPASKPATKPGPKRETKPETKPEKQREKPEADSPSRDAGAPAPSAPDAGVEEIFIP